MPRGILGDPKSPEMLSRFAKIEHFFKATSAIKAIDVEYTFINMGGKIIAFKEAECIGEGSFGKVYVGQDKDGNCFAVKQEGFKKLTQEQIAQKKLTPQRVVEINKDLRDDFLAQKETERAVLEKRGKNKGHAILDDEYFSVVRLEKGKELFKYMWKNLANWDNENPKNRKKLSKADALTIALQAAYDVHLMHTNGIIHADIKPENFMVSAETSKTLGSQITIASIDHGFSNILKEGEETILDETTKGTKGYIAPEIFYKGEYSFGSDIYALGKVFQKDLGLTLPICDNMVLYTRTRRPNALDVMNALVDELRKQPFEELDQKAIELISICETQINTPTKKYNQNVQAENKTYLPIPLKKTFKEEIIEGIINKHEKQKPNSLVFLETLNKDGNPKDVDQKAIELKGYLLQQKKHGLLLNKEQKQIRTMIADINKISRKANFIGDSGCIAIYENVSKKNPGLLKQMTIAKKAPAWVREKLSFFTGKPKSPKI